MKPWVLLLAATSLLVPAAPLAGAENAPPCEALSTNAPLVRVEFSDDCTVHAYVFHDMACLWNQESKTFGAGPVLVTYYYCTGPDPTSPASAACPGLSVNLFVEGSRIDLYPDCTFTVFVAPEITCVGPWIGHFERTVGPATLDATYCKPPNDPA